MSDQMTTVQLARDGLRRLRSDHRQWACELNEPNGRCFTCARNEQLDEAVAALEERDDAIDAVRKLRAALKRIKASSLGMSSLCMAYRVNKRPSEKTLDAAADHDEACLDATAALAETAHYGEALPDATPTPAECAEKYVSKEPPNAEDIAWAEKAVEPPRISDREREMWGLLKALEWNHCEDRDHHRHKPDCFVCKAVIDTAAFIATHRHEFERTEANQSSTANDPRATHRSRTSSGEGADDPDAAGGG